MACKPFATFDPKLGGGLVTAAESEMVRLEQSDLVSKPRRGANDLG